MRVSPPHIDLPRKSIQQPTSSAQPPCSLPSLVHPVVWSVIKSMKMETWWSLLDKVGEGGERGREAVGEGDRDAACPHSFFPLAPIRLLPPSLP